MIYAGHKLTDRIEDGDRGVDWYLLRSATRQEKRAEASLIERGFPVYVPRLADLRLNRRTHKRERVEQPLFEGYLFAGLTPDPRTRKERALSAFKLDGVSGPVRLCGEWRPVRFHMVEALVRDEVTGLFDKSLENVRQPLAVGERVMLAEGPMAGFAAEVMKLKSKDRVRLLVSVFGQKSLVTMKADQVERVA